MKKIMQNIKIQQKITRILGSRIFGLLYISLLSIFSPAHAYADCSSSGSGVSGFIDWILCSIVTFFLGIFGSSCHEVPEFTGFRSGSMTLDVDNSSWVMANAIIPTNTSLQIHWGAPIGPSGVIIDPRKYSVIYRIDPRFERPQLFILTYDYNKKSYVSDFHSYKNKALVDAQNGAAPLSKAILDYNDYFNFVGRDKIKVYQNDTLNISLISSSKFLGYSPIFAKKELSGVDALTTIGTETGLNDNSIMYLDAATYCNGLPGAKGCTDATINPATSFYSLGGANRLNLITGRLYDSDPSTICPNGAVGANFQTPIYSAEIDDYQYSPCLYDLGRGMPISVGGVLVKDIYTPFTISPAFPPIRPNASYFFNYHAARSGDLDFVTSNADKHYIPISGMYDNQLMSSWLGLDQNIDSNIVATALSGAQSRTLYAGRYIMDITVGGGNVSQYNLQNDLQLQYVVLPAGNVPDANTSGIRADQNYAANTGGAGNLWFRVVNPNTNVSGVITVGYTYYIGSSFLSDVLYGSIVRPVQDLIFNTAAQFYSALAANATLKWIIGLVLTFYIAHSSLFFLMGARQVTVSTLLDDVLRIAVVVGVLNSTSWEFFYTHVFALFLDGMSYLFVNVVGLTSNVENPFGFVDIIFQKYTDPTLWILLLSEFLSFFNGLTILAIAVIYAIIAFVSVVLEVLVTYLFAYVAIAVLISFAPLFIICLLFERTRGIFSNWMSLLFSYMIHPTILLIFFLLIDQLMTNQLNQAVTRACWGWLVALKLNLDLSWLGLGNASIPLGIGIPALIPQVSNAIVPGPVAGSAGTFLGILSGSLMFCIYSQIAKGMTGYVTQIVATLTGAQGISGAAQAIAGQISRGAKAAGKAAMKPFKGGGSKEKRENKGAEDPESKKSEGDEKGLKKRDGGDSGSNNNENDKKESPKSGKKSEDE